RSSLLIMGEHRCGKNTLLKLSIWTKRRMPFGAGGKPESDLPLQVGDFIPYRNGRHVKVVGYVFKAPATNLVQHDPGAVLRSPLARRDGQLRDTATVLLEPQP